MTIVLSHNFNANLIATLRRAPTFNLAFGRPGQHSPAMSYVNWVYQLGMKDIGRSVGIGRYR